eukprot:816262-Prymnesium_polylepis.1
MNRGSRSSFIELQVHHALVYAFNENEHAHDPYEYFRRILGGSYGPELNALLERVIVFMEEVIQTPVQLSMLILCLAHRQEGGGLPANLLELYIAAITGALRAAGHTDAGALAAGLDMMQRVAMANMLAKHGEGSDKLNSSTDFRREFTSDDLHEVLGEEGLAAWERLTTSDGTVPLVKTLEQKTVSSPALYQFRHLSFQEALFVMHLAGGGAAEWAGWKDDEAAVKSLKDPSLKNVLRIGGGALGTALGRVRDEWSFDGMLKEVEAMQLLVGLLTGNTALTSLDIANNKIDVATCAKLAVALSQMPNLCTVNLNSNHLCGVDEHGRGTFTSDAINALCAVLPKSSLTSLSVDGHSLAIDELRGTKPVEAIDLSNQRGMGVASGLIIASCIAGNEHLKSLNLDNVSLCGLDERGKGTYSLHAITALCKVLPKSSVTSLSLANNNISKADEALAEAFAKMPNLREVNISGNRFGESGETKLIEALASTQIEVLNLAENDLSGGALKDVSVVIKLAEALPLTQISSLNLANSKLTHNGKDTSAVIKLLEVLPSTRISALNLGNNELCNNQIEGDVGIKLAEAFAKMPNLVTVNLTNNRIHAEAGARLAE